MILFRTEDIIECVICADMVDCRRPGHILVETMISMS